MNLLKIARVPPLTVTPGTTVLEAVEKMVEARVGAVTVVKDDVPVGIFTERDVLRRVTAMRLPADKTSVSDVMTSPIEMAHPDTNPGDALEIMVSKHFRHLPIVDKENKLQGMLSIRHLLQCMVEQLSDELHALDSYICADGPGG
jgi:CBS domain-containing protein